MPLTAANNTMQLNITSTDINGNTSINRGAGNPTLNGVLGEFFINNNLAAGTTTLFTNAAAPAFQFYIKNNAAPGSGITVQLVLTPHGGAAQTLATLQPGGASVPFWNVVNSVIASGYDTIAVIVAGGTAPIEYFIGA